MVDKFRSVALIAVKENSDRVPNKNIRPFSNTNLLELKIEQVIKSQSVQKVVVSSESETIMNIVQKYSDVIFHKRDPYYSTNDVPMSEVYSYLASEVDSELIMWVPVTNPLAGPHIYKEAMAQYKKLESGFDSLLSCIEVKDYLIKDEQPINFSRAPWMKSQNLSGIKALSFVVNILKRNDMIKWGSLVGLKPLYITLDTEVSIDIDFQSDFDYCEYLFKKNPNKYL